MKTSKQNRLTNVIASMVAASSFVQIATASPVTLQQPTATFSQAYSSCLIGRAIDGILNDDLGWAIAPSPSSTTIPSQTAAFETAANIGFAPGSLITFSILQAHSNPGHNMGRFRFSVTTDDRSLFADGLHTGGDVTANWIVLDASSFTSAMGATLTKLGDLSILASGANPSPDTYTISAPTTLTGITGIRLEVLEDASLPFGGPGRYGANGNFLITELTMDIVAVPEPSALAIIAVAGFILGTVRRTKHA